MKDISTRVQKLMDCVYLFEDFLNSGYRKEHTKLHFTFPVIPVKKKISGSGQKQLNHLVEKIHRCTNCFLHYNRKHALAGVGVDNPDIFIIGSGPNEDEDSANRPFVGKPGEYLKKWLDAVHYPLEERCYVAHLVRCRPSNNRDPRPDEIKMCLPYFNEQMALLKPKAILCLGKIPGQVLSGESVLPVVKLRGKDYTYKGIPIIITYDPVSVLQDRDLRKPVWEDLKRLKHLVEKQSGQADE